MSDEPSWAVESCEDGWLVVAWTLKGRSIVGGPFPEEWQANVVKGQAARRWRELHTRKPIVVPGFARHE